MRVIAGKLRSRTLKTLEGRETRPTYDRLKETLFNVLASVSMLEERRWADLFAGTGAIGIEAMSRGASSVHFAENNVAAARVLRQNLQALAVEASEVAEREAVEALRRWEHAGIEFDVVFLDPPYSQHGAYAEVLRTVARGKLLAAGGIVVAEHEKRFDPGTTHGTLTRYRLLQQGESALSFYRRQENNQEEN